MDSRPETILSNLLKKRLKDLGYSSLRKFHRERPSLGLSYEALRQAVYGSHVPRPETLFRILGSMQFTPNQIRKIGGMHYGEYLPIPTSDTGIRPEPPPIAAGGPRNEPGDRPKTESVAIAHGIADDPVESASRLSALLPGIPVSGNEDFWEMVETLATLAERKSRRAAERPVEQPLLFAGEPEAIYQFLVRKNRIPPFLSRGETLSLEFVEGVDYRDRFRGALLGSAIGEAFGEFTQGLTGRDVEELFGGFDVLPPAASPRWASRHHESTLLAVANSFLPDGILDPERTARAIARTVRRDDPPGLSGFARNFLERGIAWHDAGEAEPESAPAVAVLPLALLRAGTFRRLKLEAGILASLSHVHPTAIAGAIGQACAVARVLHTPASALDVLSFSRSISHVVSGIEPERGARTRTGRSATSVGRRLGADLPALLLRRASVREMQESLGNGTAAQEGIPFALGCFLRSPGEFAGSVLSAVREGGDSRSTAAITGALCGAYVGESAIPQAFLDRLPERKELEEAADGLYALARRG
jgi:ADP-ribosylglycohydrolase